MANGQAICPLYYQLFKPCCFTASVDEDEDTRPPPPKVLRTHSFFVRTLTSFQGENALYVKCTSNFLPTDLQKAAKATSSTSEKRAKEDSTPAKLKPKTDSKPAGPKKAAAAVDTTGDREDGGDAAGDKKAGVAKKKTAGEKELPLCPYGKTCYR